MATRQKLDGRVRKHPAGMGGTFLEGHAVWQQTSIGVFSCEEDQLLEISTLRQSCSRKVGIFAKGTVTLSLPPLSYFFFCSDESCLSRFGFETSRGKTDCLTAPNTHLVTYLVYEYQVYCSLSLKPMFVCFYFTFILRPVINDALFLEATFDNVDGEMVLALAQGYTRKGITLLHCIDRFNCYLVFRKRADTSSFCS